MVGVARRHDRENEGCIHVPDIIHVLGHLFDGPGIAVSMRRRASSPQRSVFQPVVIPRGTYARTTPPSAAATSLVDNIVDYGYHDFTELWVRYEVRADANA
jgi:hypothetical protein